MKKDTIFTTGLIVVLLNFHQLTFSCTNFLIGKGASTDGSAMITYAADSHALYGELYYYPATVYPEEAMLDIYDWDTGKYLGQIKQAARTYTVVGNMNEYQLAIGETTYGGRHELVNKKGKIDYGSLMWITLQRAKTAREAIKTMSELIAEYGYYSSGESFSISDPDEVWIMEMIGKGEGNKGVVWVARKIPDDCVSGHANHARITTFPLKQTDDCMFSPDARSFAREKGYFSGKDKDFSFSDAYAPLDYSASRFCEARVWSMFRRVNKDAEKYISYIKGESTERMPLWIKPDKKLSLHDVMELMRDHFEGTGFDMTKDVGAGPYKCPYRWRGLTWKVDDKTYLNERATSTQQTAFSFVAQSRSWLPNPIGGVLWFGVDDTYSTVYVPMYCCIKNVPESYAVGTASFIEFSWESAFWVFNFVANYAYSRYCDMITDIREVQAELEGQFIAKQPGVEEAAQKLYNDSPQLAIDYLTGYSANQGQNVTRRWKKLGEQLLFKYLDGNVKDEYNKPTHPGYPQDWYRRIVDETGDHFEMKKIEGETGTR